jgi:hypothetical protein
MSALVLTAKHPKRGILFAVVDPNAHHVGGQIAERKFPAFLTPFPSIVAAKDALAAAGATIGGHCG